MLLLLLLQLPLAAAAAAAAATTTSDATATILTYLRCEIGWSSLISNLSSWNEDQIIITFNKVRAVASSFKVALDGTTTAAASAATPTTISTSLRSKI